MVIRKNRINLHRLMYMYFISDYMNKRYSTSMLLERFNRKSVEPDYELYC